MNILPLAAAALLFATPALAEDFTPKRIAPNSEGLVHFVMPSENIECFYTPKGGAGAYMPADGGPELSCDRAEPTYLRFVLGAKGPAKMIKNVGDQSCCGGENYLDYGRSWQAAAFTCWSTKTGLTCERDDGHGFLISRAKVDAY